MIMRSTVALAALILLAGGISAQDLRINLTGGYIFRDRFPLTTTLGVLEATIREAPVFGGGLEYLVNEDYGMELYYMGMPTVGSLRDRSQRYSEDLMVNYIMAGGVRYAPFAERVKGFGGVSLGIALFEGETVSRAYAAWGLRGGVLINATERIGLRIGAQLHSPIEAVGGGLYIGTGGTGGGVQTYSTIYQFGFVGGLSFTL
jgi:hypothetical protein